MNLILIKINDLILIKNSYETCDNVNNSNIDINVNVVQATGMWVAWKLQGSIGTTNITTERSRLRSKIMPLFRTVFCQKDASPGRGSILSAASSIIPFGRCYNVSDLMGVHCTRIPAPPIVVVNQQPEGWRAGEFWSITSRSYGKLILI